MKTAGKIISALLVLSFVFTLCACTPPAENTEPANSGEREIKTNVAVPKGPLGMGLAKLKADKSYAYDVKYYDSVQYVEDCIIDGSADIAVLPIDRAVNIYNRTGGGIRIIAINSLGNGQVLYRGSKKISSVDDLKDKTVYTSGQGTVSQYAAEYILSENGIKPKKLKYVDSFDELVTMASEGKADYCILPEPYATELRYATNPLVNTKESTTPEQKKKAEKDFPKEKRWKKGLSLSEEWENITGEKFAYGCVVAKTDYIEANPDIISEFLIFNEVSVNWIKAFDDREGTYNNIYILLEQDIYSDKARADSTFRSSNVVFIEKEAMMSAIDSTLTSLYTVAPDLFDGDEVKASDICFTYE